MSRKKEVSTATVQTSTITLIDVIICSVAFKAKESKIGGGWGTKEEGKENCLSCPMTLTTFALKGFF